jgi:anthranilate synthase component 1
LDEALFDKLAGEGYNRIPVHRQVLADLDTPLSVYLKLVDGPNSYLFESVEGGERWGRYSIIGLPCRQLLRVRGPEVIHETDGRETSRETPDDPLAAIQAWADTFQVPELEGLPKFTGGLVGYFGYDTVRYMEPRLAGVEKPDPVGGDDIRLMLSEELAVFDNLAGRLFLVINADPGEPGAWRRAQRRLDQLAHRLRGGGPGYPYVIGPESVAEDDFVSGFSREGFEAAVRRCQEYIAAGDIMQVVLSQRLSVPFRARPVDVYRALRSLNPSPYMYFMDMDGTHIVGSSPEILVQVEGGETAVRPIAGTRRRGATPEEDAALADELLADPKERAEHVMLIDLGRNDVGRVAETGTVELRERMVIERYSHVMHIVSHVAGRLRAGLGAMDALRATFPAGTLSGAPKIRAMEIIDELEPVKRGVYAGAVGYLNWAGDMDVAIAIRTAVISDGQLHVQAGAGIVADSDPATEWEETMSKGRALFRAVSDAAGGLE